MQPRLWWWGLPVLAVVWVGSNVLRTEPLEKDLNSRAHAALGTSGVLASAEGRDVLLRGAVASDNVASTYIQSIRNNWGVRKVVSALVQPPEIKPFVMNLTRKNGAISVSGSLPADSKEATLKSIQDVFPSVKINDTTALARGAPAGFAAMSALASQHLAGLKEGEAILSDTSYSISGVATDAAAYEKIKASVMALPSGFKLAREDVRIERVSPYVWSALKVGNGFVLTGFAPQDVLRQGVIQAASADGRSATDQMRLAGGIPIGVDYKAVTSFALRQLSKLESGKATLVDNVLSITGSARDGAVESDVTAAFAGSLPGGIKAGDVDIEVGRVSPYTFSAVRDPKTITLSGYVPDNKAKTDILGFVKRRFLGESVVDQMKVASGAPQQYMNVVNSALDQLSRLATGKVDISDLDLKITGQALYERARDEIRNQINTSLPSGWKGGSSIEVRLPDTVIPAAECQGVLVELMGRGRILFETGSATIYKDSFGLLDNLVFVLKRCPEAKVNIAGHTDTDGGEATNLDLSRRRAQAVADYLIEASVEDKRLSAVGYGSSRALAPNDTEENKARNRRIEFIVQ
jgi:OmpA-OmpF porin, OOP family